MSIPQKLKLADDESLEVTVRNTINTELCQNISEEVINFFQCHKFFKKTYFENILSQTKRRLPLSERFSIDCDETQSVQNTGKYCFFHSTSSKSNFCTKNAELIKKDETDIHGEINDKCDPSLKPNKKESCEANEIFLKLVNSFIPSDCKDLSVSQVDNVKKSSQYLSAVETSNSHINISPDIYLSNIDITGDHCYCRPTEPDITGLDKFFRYREEQVQSVNRKPEEFPHLNLFSKVKLNAKEYNFAEGSLCENGSFVIGSEVTVPETVLYTDKKSCSVPNNEESIQSVKRDDVLDAHRTVTQALDSYKNIDVEHGSVTKIMARLPEKNGEGFLEQIHITDSEKELTSASESDESENASSLDLQTSSMTDLETYRVKLLKELADMNNVVGYSSSDSEQSVYTKSAHCKALGVLPLHDSEKLGFVLETDSKGSKIISQPDCDGLKNLVFYSSTSESSEKDISDIDINMSELEVLDEGQNLPGSLKEKQYNDCTYNDGSIIEEVPPDKVEQNEMVSNNFFICMGNGYSEDIEFKKESSFVNLGCGSEQDDDVDSGKFVTGMKYSGVSCSEDGSGNVDSSMDHEAKEAGEFSPISGTIEVNYTSRDVISSDEDKEDQLVYIEMEDGICNDHQDNNMRDDVNNNVDNYHVTDFAQVIAINKWLNKCYETSDSEDDIEVSNRYDKFKGEGFQEYRNIDASSLSCSDEETEEIPGIDPDECDDDPLPELNLGTKDLLTLKTIKFVIAKTRQLLEMKENEDKQMKSTDKNMNATNQNDYMDIAQSDNEKIEVDQDYLLNKSESKNSELFFKGMKRPCLNEIDRIEELKIKGSGDFLFGNKNEPLITESTDVCTSKKVNIDGDNNFSENDHNATSGVLSGEKQKTETQSKKQRKRKKAQLKAKIALLQQIKESEVEFKYNLMASKKKDSTGKTTNKDAIIIDYSTSDENDAIFENWFAGKSKLPNTEEFRGIHKENVDKKLVNIDDQKQKMKSAIFKSRNEEKKKTIRCYRRHGSIVKYKCKQLGRSPDKLNRSSSKRTKSNNKDKKKSEDIEKDYETYSHQYEIIKKRNYDREKLYFDNNQSMCKQKKIDDKTSSVHKGKMYKSQFDEGLSMSKSPPKINCSKVLVLRSGESVNDYCVHSNPFYDTKDTDSLKVLLEQVEPILQEIKDQKADQNVELSHLKEKKYELLAWTEFYMSRILFLETGYSVFNHHFRPEVPCFQLQDDRQKFQLLWKIPTVAQMTDLLDWQDQIEQFQRTTSSKSDESFENDLRELRDEMIRQLCTPDSEEPLYDVREKLMYYRLQREEMNNLVSTGKAFSNIQCELLKYFDIMCCALEKQLYRMKNKLSKESDEREEMYSLKQVAQNRGNWLNEGNHEHLEGNYTSSVSLEKENIEETQSTYEHHSRKCDSAAMDRCENNNRISGSPIDSKETETTSQSQSDEFSAGLDSEKLKYLANLDNETLGNLLRTCLPTCVESVENSQLNTAQNITETNTNWNNASYVSTVHPTTSTNENQIFGNAREYMYPSDSVKNTESKSPSTTTIINNNFFLSPPNYAVPPVHSQLPQSTPLWQTHQQHNNTVLPGGVFAHSTDVYRPLHGQRRGPLLKSPQEGCSPVFHPSYTYRTMLIQQEQNRYIPQARPSLNEVGIPPAGIRQLPSSNSVTVMDIEDGSQTVLDDRLVVRDNVNNVDFSNINTETNPSYRWNVEMNRVQRRNALLPFPSTIQYMPASNSSITQPYNYNVPNSH